MQGLEFDFRHSLIPKTSIFSVAKECKAYLSRLKIAAVDADYFLPESSLFLSSDKSLFQKSQQLCRKKKTSKLKYIFVVGIGGSNLGTQAVYEALRGPNDQFNEQVWPKLLFADTSSPRLLSSLISIIQSRIRRGDEFLINLITKSGTTTESIVNFEILFQALQSQVQDIHDRVVVTTDEGSTLWQQAARRGVDCLTIPKSIGGRYSVFSPVSVFPLSLAGFNMSSFLEGALLAQDHALGVSKLSQNPTVVSAVTQYIYYQQGRTINNHFFFNPELEATGKWFRQLLAESLGKETNTPVQGERVGITPIVSIGSTDLHSMAQLYFSGPENQFTVFVFSRKASQLQVPKKLFFPDLVDAIAGADVSELLGAIYDGTLSTYKKHRMPFIEIQIPDIDERSLGQFFQMKMIEVMLLGHLLNVNAFDQPSVEEYKHETRRILKHLH